MTALPADNQDRLEGERPSLKADMEEISPTKSEGVTSEFIIREIAPADRYPLVGGLSSAIVHMLLLISLGLLFSTVQQEGALELQMAVANTHSADELETFDVELEEIAEPTLEVDAVTASNVPADLTVHEPTLALDFEDLATKQATFDPLQSVTESERAGAKKSGEESDKQGTFFGAQAYGDEFVYVVDMSTSMGHRSAYGQTRFRIACRELLRSIQQLTPDQSFCVLMFCYRTRVMFDAQPRMLPATVANKQRIAMWVQGLGLGGGTDPRFGTMLALQLKPDAIFLLSDGEFNGRDVNAHGIKGNVPIERIIAQQRQDAVPIHTIAFEDMANRKRLRRIATGTHGTHRFVGDVSDQALVIDDLASRNLNDVAYGMQCLIEGTHRIRDDRHLRTATSLIAKYFTARKPALRKRAYQTMLTLSKDVDIGPGNEDATASEFAVAQKAWRAYWKEYFRQRRAEALGRRERDEAQDLSLTIESI